MTKLLGLIQLVALASQGSPELLGIIPPKYHGVWHFGWGLGQAACWYWQRGYNPDGTAAAASYVPKSKTEIKEPATKD